MHEYDEYHIFFSNHRTIRLLYYLTPILPSSQFFFTWFPLRIHRSLALFTRFQLRLPYVQLVIIATSVTNVL